MSDAETSVKVTVGTYSYLYEAETARMLLFTNGIEAELLDSEIAATHPFLSNAVGGIRVAVSSENARKASEILREDQKSQGERFRKRCFDCDSDDVIEIKATWKTWILGLLTLGLYFPTLFKANRCRSCGRRW